MTRPLQISVIIPCWKDESHLEHLLLQLRRAEAEDDVPLQIIIVDAATSEHCRALCQRIGALWLPAAPSRGVQLRQGAALAEHDVLWFLHADAQLEGQPLASIRCAIEDGASGGYFAFRFSDTHDWQGRLIERLIAWRNQVGVPYGDQGLFAKRAAYLAVGQHAPWPLFEEVPMVQGLRGHGQFHRIEHGLRVSPRRWKREGWWRRTWRNRLLALGFMLNISPFTLARLYTRKDAPSSGATGEDTPEERLRNH